MARKKSSRKKSTRRTTSRRSAEQTMENAFMSCAKSCKTKCNSSNSGGGLYCLGFLGALVYYITTATSFWGGVVGVLKALVWPAFLVFELMKYLGM